MTWTAPTNDGRTSPDGGGCSGGGVAADLTMSPFADGDLDALANGSYVDTFAIVADALQIAYNATTQTNGLDGFNDLCPERKYDLTAAGFTMDGFDLIVDIDLAGMTSNGDFVGLGISVINDEATPEGVGVYILDHFGSGSKRYGDLTSTSLAVRGSIDFKYLRLRVMTNDETINILISGKMDSTDTWERIDEFYEQGPLLTSSSQLYLKFHSVRNGATGSLDGRTDNYGITWRMHAVPDRP